MALSPLLRRQVNDAKNKYSRSDGKTVKPKEGRSVWRILAPTQAQASWIDASGKFWADLGVHWIKAEPNSKPIAVVGSRDVCYQQPCPVGTAVELAMSQAHDEETKKVYQEWRVSKSVLFNAIDRSTNAAAEQVDILEVRPTVAQQILDIMSQYDDAGQDITDLSHGVDLVITRTGKGLNTEYTVNVKPGDSKPVPASAIGNCHDLPAYIEREFFRGDEPKALGAIAQITGLAIPQIGHTASPQLSGPAMSQIATTRTPTAALTSDAMTVADATPAAAPAAPAEDPAVAEARRQLEEAQRRVAEAQAAVTAAAPASAAPAAAPETTLSTADVEDVLKDLDNI